MRLDFNVLWIDDQPAAIRSYRTAIKRRLAKEGFNFAPTNEKTIDKALGHLSDNVFLDEVDLVLVDYDLGKGPTGDTALKKIRRSLPYKEIVFYSAKTSADLKKLAFEQDVQGLYCASREDLVDTIVGVFETLVKKVLDIDHMRGIVMGATSDIDAIVQDCLQAMHDSSDEDGQETMLSIALERVAKSAKHSKKTHKEALSSDNFSSLVEGRALTAFNKLIILIKTLDGEQYKEFKGQQKSIQEYLDKTLPLRNKLGHVQLVADNGTRIFQGRDGKKISVDDMKELRCALLDHRDAFLSLVAKLSPVKG